MARWNPTYPAQKYFIVSNGRSSYAALILNARSRCRIYSLIFSISFFFLWQRCPLTFGMGIEYKWGNKIKFCANHSTPLLKCGKKKEKRKRKPLDLIWVMNTRNGELNLDQNTSRNRIFSLVRDLIWAYIRRKQGMPIYFQGLKFNPFTLHEGL